jgi:TatD DNase family protein
MLETAAELNKPLVIHCREARQDMLRILKSFFGGTARKDVCIGVIHCFAGDLNFAEGCMDLGFFLGVDGPITYPNAHQLREVMAQVPLEKIVLETDCPYLPPQGFRGKRNESSYLPLIAQKLAEMFGKSTEEIGRITTDNAKKLFRIKK